MNVYRNFNVDPKFTKKEFGNTILKYEKGSNKKPNQYWDSIRPLPLTVEEKRDYVKKDSLEQLRNDPHYLDSLDKISNKYRISNFLFSGKQINNQKRKLSYTLPSLAQGVSFNVVEGLVIDAPISIRKEFTERKSITFIPHVRYGFSGKQFYGWGTIRYNYGKKYLSLISLSGGKRIYQHNNENPIDAMQNNISSLLYKRNFYKLYAANYARLAFSKGIGGGFTVFGNVQFQDRIPLQNTTDFSFSKTTKRYYTPNYPIENPAGDFTRHQSTVLTIGFTVQPKSRYIEFPERIINIGSGWPSFNLQYSKGVHGLLGSDVDFDKWQLTVRDNLNFKLFGRLNYRLQTGGFINCKMVPIQDMKHFPGNRLFMSKDFLSVYQVTPYYLYSNTESIYGAAFVEHHFNGFLTNKIPGFRKLNWNLVAGTSLMWLPKTTYVEWHAGLENIFRVLRVDVVAGYQQGKVPVYELRIGSSINISRTDD